jgi:peptidoglycan/LPS O-acetylase OafA/YrhL
MSDADTPSRIARAFSLQDNLRALLVPGPGRLAPLDGLRALSMLWVVLFHAGWYIVPYVPLPVYFELVTSRAMLPVWRGDFGVDVFFVLSGFLIAGMLVDEQDRNGKLRIALFSARRITRLWPALAVAVLADVLLVDDRPNMVWANLLYVSNFLSIYHAAMGWTWSLSIEEQFYLLSPWLVVALAPASPQLRAAVPLFVAVALTFVGAEVVLRDDFHAPDAEIVLTRGIDAWARSYDLLYVKPWMRAGPLLAGIAAAYVYRLPGAMEAIARQHAPAALGFVAALVVAALATHWPLVEGAPRGVEVAYLATFRTAFGVAVAYVLLFSLSQHPLGVAVGRLLSARVLFPLAQISYCAYLLNPIATIRMDRLLAPFVQSSGLPAFPVLLVADAAVTFVAAVVLHLFVERPFMALRPRGRTEAQQER